MIGVAEKNWTIREALEWAEEYLKGYEVPDAKAETEYLLMHIENCKRVELHLDSHKTLDSHEMQRFADFIERKIRINCHWGEYDILKRIIIINKYFFFQENSLFSHGQIFTFSNIKN